MPEIHSIPSKIPFVWKNAIFFMLIAMAAFSCKDKVKEFDGFTQKELEYLLASDSAKSWLRVVQTEDGDEIVPDDCGMENRLIFIQDKDSLGRPKPLLYAYDPEICDSLDFCLAHPDFCQSDTMMCHQDTLFCESLEKGTLYIGSWYAREPFIENTRADTLVFEINRKTESIWVTDISSQYLTIKYKNRTGENGGEITEYYKYVSPVEN